MMNGMRVSFLNRFLRMTAVVLAAAFAFLLAGCGGSSASTSFTWFVDNIPANLDPQVATKAEDVIACENLYGGLVRRNASGELVPDLCERWEISSDGLTYTFYLKSGLTFAAEAGTQRLRNVINKNVTWDEIEKTCTIAFNAGYTSVKLYFMMGLPTETMEDIEGIAETAQKVVDLYYKNTNHAKGRGVQVTISCACFVPKPHTPFQFVPMDTAETLQAKQKHLLESVHSRKIKVNYHDSTTSFLEGVFAKGDRRLAPVIVEAYKRGCYFDGWEECFKYDTWMQTFADLGIDPAFYCQRPIALDEVTPWSHMDYGITHEYLVREYNKALAAQTTPPCNRACNACGANHLLGGPCFDYSQNLV